MRFDLRFPKTGGGEDIDYCIQSKLATGGRLLPAPAAHVAHPWWDGGHPKLSHFYGWSHGDGHLQFIYPQFAYRNWPNVWELSLVLLMVQLMIFGLSDLRCTLAILVVWIVEFAMEHRDTWAGGSAAARCWSFAVKSVLELGHLLRNLSYFPRVGLCLRFDWFCGTEPNAIATERCNAFRRFIAMLIANALVAWLF